MAMSNASTSTLNQDNRELGFLVTVKGEQEAGGEEGCLGEESVPHVEYFLVSFIV